MSEISHELPTGFTACDSAVVTPLARRCHAWVTWSGDRRHVSSFPGNLQRLSSSERLLVVVDRHNADATDTQWRATLAAFGLLRATTAVLVESTGEGLFDICVWSGSTKPVQISANGAELKRVIDRIAHGVSGPTLRVTDNRDQTGGGSCDVRIVGLGDDDDVAVLEDADAAFPVVELLYLLRRDSS